MDFSLTRGPTMRTKSFLRDRRAAEMLEIAIVFPVFLLFLLFVFEIAYDQFQQTELEGALQITAYQVQTGHTLDTAGANPFIQNYLCANALGGALRCDSLYVRVQKVDPATCSTPANDFYNATGGNVPVTGGALQLGAYQGDNGNSGSGLAVGPIACGGSQTGFCNAGPNQFIILSAIYVSPDFLGGLVAGAAYTYNGSLIHAVIATTAFYTEQFAASTNTTVPQC